jgi:hypothetical protein
MGPPITPENLAAVCEEALSLGNVPSGWGVWVRPGGYRSAEKDIPAIRVMDRFRIGAPMQIWPANGPQRHYSAAFLAQFTLVDIEADRHAWPQERTGWRGLWDRLFPPDLPPRKPYWVAAPPGWRDPLNDWRHDL